MVGNNIYLENQTILCLGHDADHLQLLQVLGQSEFDIIDKILRGVA